ncbi:MAG: endonuclease III [Dehalococcoidia bacterium]
MAKAKGLGEKTRKHRVKRDNRRSSTSETMEPGLSVEEIIRRLEPLYGPAQGPRQWDPISELIFTILSQNTSDYNSERACANLMAAFDSWEEMAYGDVGKIAAAIQIGGLAKIKAPRIQAVLRTIIEKRGPLNLSFLAEMPLKEAKEWLRQLPGVGPKTAGCVLLFALNKPAMVVDTHVYRVSKRLGLVGPKVSADDSHEILEELVPPQDVLPFHVYLITHGRRVCKAQRPLCPQCVLEDGCPSSLLRQPAQSH